MYVEYSLNKSGHSGSFYINYPYLRTYYLVLKWVKARKLPHFIFIMLFFKTVVATRGSEHPLTISSLSGKLLRASTMAQIAP
jgi:hypothetical protein